MCLLIAEGLQDKEIASRLKNPKGAALSEHTVRHYIHTLFLKLDVDSRELVIIWAFRSGLVPFSRSKALR